MPAYKDKKRGTWFFKCYYTDYKGDQRQKLVRGFEKRKDAEKAEREFLEKQSFQPDMPFSAFVTMYQKEMDKRLRRHTIQRRNYQLQRIIPFFADMPLNEISAKDIRRWQNQLISEKLSQGYIRSLNATLSAIFNHAVKFYGLAVNPCKIAGAAKVPNQKSKQMRFWTFKEYSKVIKHVDDIKAKTAIMVLYWSGMRKGELYALRWSDIDFKENTINIDESLQRLNGENVVTPTKTNEVRNIIMPSFVMERLSDYKAKLYHPTPDSFVFPWEKRFIENGISEGCKATGVKRIHVHGLRHSHASLLISQGENIVLISKRLGHANVSMTLDTYSHFFPDDEKQLVENLENLVSK